VASLRPLSFHPRRIGPRYPLCRRLYMCCKLAVPYLRRTAPCFRPRRPGFEPRTGHVRFVVDKVALAQVFSDYFDFLCQFSFHRLLHNHHLSCGAGTKSQIVADIPSGLSLTPPQETNYTGNYLTRRYP
jgi:hypothetical protein